VRPKLALREARLSAGLSQSALADLVNIEIGRATKQLGALDGNTVSRIERGAVERPSQWTVNALCAVLRSTETDLGLALPEPVRWAVERGLATPEALDELSVTLASLRRLEDTTSARAVLPSVRDLLSVAWSYTSLAPQGIRRSTLSLASELHTYLGWLELDTGAGGRAAGNFDTAVSLAVEADDADHLSHAASFKGYLALRRGRFDQAVSLSRVSNRDARTFLALRVFDGYQEGWAHALAGDVRDAERAMLAVDGWLEQVPDSEAPPGAYWYDVPFLLTQRANVHESLGRRTAAISDLETGLAEMPAEHRLADWSRDIRQRLAALQS
jgi:transcriptional regulator with XRE-family HTH domain